jgi:uncharacterized protein
MLIRQQQWSTIDQYRKHTQIRFVGTTWDNPIMIDVEVADTPYKREYGLMFRWQINWGNGMLFVFDDETMRSFWMKNTYIPLDMIFINTSGTIVSIKPGTKPMDETPVSSDAPARYVIEVNSWRTLEAWLKPGMSIDLNTIESVKYSKSTK